MAQGTSAKAAAAEFQEHAVEEQQHADSIAARIVQLGARAQFFARRLLSRSHAECVEE